jgi:hypothetical protein
MEKIIGIIIIVGIICLFFPWWFSLMLGVVFILGYGDKL